MYLLLLHAASADDLSHWPVAGWHGGVLPRCICGADMRDISMRQHTVLWHALKIIVVVFIFTLIFAQTLFLVFSTRWWCWSDPFGCHIIAAMFAMNLKWFTLLLALHRANLRQGVSFIVTIIYCSSRWPATERGAVKSQRRKYRSKKQAKVRFPVLFLTASTRMRTEALPNRQSNDSATDTRWKKHTCTFYQLACFALSQRWL